MAQENRTTLKTYFETGDTPTQAQFINLLDSLLNLVDAGLTEGDIAALSGSTFTGQVINTSAAGFLSENANPRYELSEPEVDTAFRTVRIILGNGDFRIVTYTGAGVFVSIDQEIKRNAGGAYEHRLNIQNVRALEINETEFLIKDVSGNTITTIGRDGTADFGSTVTIGAYTLPATDGTAGQVLTTDGNGNVTWETP